MYNITKKTATLKSTARSTRRDMRERERAAKWSSYGTYTPDERERERAYSTYQIDDGESVSQEAVGLVDGLSQICC